MIPRPSRGYFFNGYNPLLLATPKRALVRPGTREKLLLATRKRVLGIKRQLFTQLVFF